MIMEDFYVAITPVFTAANHPVIEFTFNEQTNEFVSTEKFIKDDNTEYIVVVKNDGRVVYGFTDGLDFVEKGTLGYM